MPALLCAAQGSATIPDFDLGSGVSSHQRFLLYPHLQKGWESMHRGDRDRALRELEHARRLAPDNAAVALLLVEAYQKFGESGRAESVLREQLKRTSHDARLATAMTSLQVKALPPARTSEHVDGKSPVPGAGAAAEPAGRLSSVHCPPHRRGAARHAQLP